MTFDDEKRMKAHHHFQSTAEYASLPRIHRLWIDLSIAQNHVESGESILAKRACRPWVSDDPDVVDEAVSMAWNRIRTYPSQRSGPVAGNVLLDVRKEVLRTRGDGAVIPASDPLDRSCADSRQTPEEAVCGRAVVEELAAARDRGMVSSAALATIFRTRVDGESLADVAEDMGMSPDAMWRRRSRAERRLRSLPLAS